MKSLGDAAEERAAGYLAAKGYRIVERNFRAKVGELDIVAQDGDTLVFVEVRSRASVRFGLPQETVTAAKRRRIVKTAQLYAQARGLDCPMRIDVLAETQAGFEHIEDAFGA